MTALGGLHVAVLHDPALVTARLVAEVNRLLPQLAPSAAPVTADGLADVVRSSATRLLLARDADSHELIGMLTVVVVPLITSMSCRIEDVVVDSAHRGRGIGKTLIELAALVAREENAAWVELTSRPARADAIRLYERLGFVRRETNVYRLALGPPLD